MVLMTSSMPSRGTGSGILMFLRSRRPPIASDDMAGSTAAQSMSLVLHVIVVLAAAGRGGGFGELLGRGPFGVSKCSRLAAPGRPIFVGRRNFGSEVGLRLFRERAKAFWLGAAGAARASQAFPPYPTGGAKISRVPFLSRVGAKDDIGRSAYGGQRGFRSSLAQ